MQYNMHNVIITKNTLYSVVLHSMSENSSQELSMNECMN